VKKAEWKSEVEDYNSEIEVTDSENQLLQFRVGQVFFNKGQRTQIGLWIWYQEKKLNSKLKGPVLMDKDSWDQVKKYIDKKFKYLGL
jgi:hypothetical protein